MTVKLFIKNPNDVTRTSEPWSSRLKEAAHSLVFLEFPVRLRIGDVDLFQVDEEAEPSDAYLDVPILRMAIHGPAVLAAAKRHGRCAFELQENPGAILFEVHGDDVLVHCTITCLSAWARYDELLRVWRAFGEDVRALVIQRHPGIEHDDAWRHWFATGVVPEAVDCRDHWFDDEGPCLAAARVDRGRSSPD